MSTYHEDRARERAEVIAMLTEVASMLGEGWSLSAEPDRATTLDGPGGARIYAQRWPDSDRLELTGGFPDGTHRHIYGVERTEITVGMTRAPKAVAGEIARRLLPKYLPELERVQARLATVDTQRAHRERVGAELAAALGTTWRDNGDQERGSAYYAPTTPGYGTLELSGDASTGSIELRGIPMDTLRAVVAVLAGAAS